MLDADMLSGYIPPRRLLLQPPKGSLTCPLHDRMFLDLVWLAEWCGEKNGCDTCPKKEKCMAWLNRYAEKSSVRNLRPGEKAQAIKEFRELSFQFTMKMAIMSRR